MPKLRLSLAVLSLAAMVVPVPAHEPPAIGDLVIRKNLWRRDT